MKKEHQEHDNQRHHPRRAAFIIAEYTVRKGTFRDIIKNIGADGLFINTTRQVAEGQTITLHFPLFEFEHPIRAAGKVSRRAPNGFAVAFDRPIPGLICREGHFPEIVHEMDRVK